MRSNRLIVFECPNAPPTHASIPPSDHHEIGTLNVRLTALPVRGTHIVNGSCGFNCSVTNPLVSLTFPGTVTGIGAEQLFVEDETVNPVMILWEVSMLRVMTGLHLSRAIR